MCPASNSSASRTSTRTTPLASSPRTSPGSTSSIRDLICLRTSAPEGLITSGSVAPHFGGARPPLTLAGAPAPVGAPANQALQLPRSNRFPLEVRSASLRTGSIARRATLQHRVWTPFQAGAPNADAVGQMRRIPLLWQLLAINTVLIG